MNMKEWNYRHYYICSFKRILCGCHAEAYKRCKRMKHYLPVAEPYPFRHSCSSRCVKDSCNVVFIGLFKYILRVSGCYQVIVEFYVIAWKRRCHATIAHCNYGTYSPQVLS